MSALSASASVITFDDAVTEFEQALEKQRWVFTDKAGRKEEVYGVGLFRKMADPTDFKEAVDKFRGKRTYVTRRLTAYREAIADLEAKLKRVPPSPAVKKFHQFAVKPLREMFDALHENPNAANQRWQDAASEFVWHLDQQKTITLK